MGAYEFQGVPAEIVFADIDGEVTKSDRVLVWAGMVRFSPLSFSP